MLVGDSTMATRTGYGDALCQRVLPPPACVNLGRGGRSTLSYRAEGLWDEVLSRLRAAPAGSAPHVLIQFGHNDQPGKPGRSTELATEYPANLSRFVAETRAAGGVPVLVTPLTRRSFEGTMLKQDLKDWAEAMREVARAQGVALVDLNAASTALVQPLGQAGADALAMVPPPAPGAERHKDFDRTHVGPYGACVFAELMARLLAEQLPALRPQLSPGPGCSGGVSPAR
jgi:lysophospholipase L1-like esterase